jgi:hypothetical protein
MVHELICRDKIWCARLLAVFILAAGPYAVPASTPGFSLGSTVFLGAEGSEYNPSVRLLFDLRSPLPRSAFSAGWAAGAEWFIPRGTTNTSSNWQLTFPARFDLHWRAREGDSIVRPGLGLGPTFIFKSRGSVAPLFGVALVAEAKVELGVGLGMGAFVLIPSYQARFQWLATGFNLLHGVNLSVALQMNPKAPRETPQTNQSRMELPQAEPSGTGSMQTNRSRMENPQTNSPGSVDL